MQKLMQKQTVPFKKAEQTTDRREAIRCIRESTKQRELMAD